MIAILLAALIATPGAPRANPPLADPAPEIQLSDEQIRDRVEAYLGAIDRPITAARWKTLGPNAAPLLEAVIANGNDFPTRRAKALEGLVAVAPDRAATMVGKIARDEKQPVVVRVAAMRGASEVLAPSKALSELRPVLRASKNSGVRAEAADVIARKQGGCAEVRDQVARESAELRPAFGRALKRCGE